MKKLGLFVCSLLIVFGVVFACAGCNAKQFFCSHNYEEQIQEATCAAEGKVVRTCLKCGKVRTKPIAKLEHTWAETTTIEPACDHEGYSLRVCAVCGEEEKFDVVESTPHTWGEQTTIESTCMERGYQQNTCSVCGHEEKTNFVDALGHAWGEWRTIKEATPIENGLQQKTCSRCLIYEDKVVLALSYVDTSILYCNANLFEQCTANSQEEFNILYGAAILNRVPQLVCKINFVSSLSGDTANQILNNARNSVDVGVGYSYSGSFGQSSRIITVNFTHQSLPECTTEADDRCYQKNSMNLIDFEQTRANDFDGFKINGITKTYSVSTSDQLFYCLERRIKPIPVSGSAAESMLNKMKDVLREIVDDNMTDAQKVLAIHDWLVMNVVYDEALLNLFGSGQNLKIYNGFYLEGVFDDGIAVCDGISKAFCALCNIEGIPCVQVIGTSKESGVGHAWNKVYVDGDWYIVDATSDGIIVNSQYEVLSYSHFLIDDQTMNQNYEASDYTEIECNATYNVWTLFVYDHNGTSFDLYVESAAELDVVVAYFKAHMTTNTTFEFCVAFNFGSSPQDEVQTSGAKCGLSTFQYKCILSGTSNQYFMFIK